MEDLSVRFIKSLLLPGDVLLFDRKGFFNTLIKLKRGEKYSHTEVYAGGDKTFASRNGIGVAYYDLDVNGLAAIYRTGLKEFDLEAGKRWFWQKDDKGNYVINGQGYDWVGLLSFSWASFQGKENGKMFCSEFVMRFFRACGVDLYPPEVDADAVSPGLLAYSLRLFKVWSKK